MRPLFFSCGSMMKSEPILIHDARPTSDEVCLRRLIELLGLTCRTVDTPAFNAELDQTADHDLCILASAATLEKWCHSFPSPTSALDELRQKSSSLFVYG